MDRKSDDVRPILVARDRVTRMTVSFLVQRKGVVNDNTIKRLLQFSQELGYHENKVVFQFDQESPMWAVVESEAQTSMKHSAVRSSIGLRPVCEHGKASTMLGIGFAKTVMFRRVPLFGKLA